MGKGDQKSTKGKRTRGTPAVRRQNKKSSTIVIVEKPKAAKKKVAPKKTVAKKTTAKKTAAKKTIKKKKAED